MKSKILFCNGTGNGMQQEVCMNLVSILHTLPIEMDLLNSNLDLHHTNYDLAITYNRQGYNGFKKLGLNIPLLYVLSSDDFCSEMLFDSSLYVHVLMINSYETVYSNSFVSQSSFPFMVKSIVPPIKEKKNKRLLVDVGNTISLMNLLPLLNIYIDYEIDILTDKPYKLNDLVNAHIQLSTRKNRDQLIGEADILIAEGYTALKGVMQRKPVFVLGERGFGGLVEKDNVREQYRTGFSGRLGGVKDEYLPLPMMDYEMKKVLNERVEGLIETADALCECCRETSDKLCGLVSFFVALSRVKEKVLLQKNHYMDYIHTDEAGIYWVVDKVYGKFLFEIDETEKCLVDCFESPRQLNSVYKEMKDSMSVEEIEKSVDDLLQYKLLDYCIV
mgnify:FL=1